MSTISTFKLNTLTLELSVFFFFVHLVTLVDGLSGVVQVALTVHG